MPCSHFLIITNPKKWSSVISHCNYNESCLPCQRFYSAYKPNQKKRTGEKNVEHFLHYCILFLFSKHQLMIENYRHVLHSSYTYVNFSIFLTVFILGLYVFISHFWSFMFDFLLILTSLPVSVSDLVIPKSYKGKVSI